MRLMKKNENGATLGYMMQSGAGSTSLKLSYTRQVYKPQWSYGFQGNTRVYIGKNSKGYRLGNRYDASVWIAKSWMPTLSSSLRVSGISTGKVDGQHKDITLMQSGMNPALNSSNTGGSEINISVGINAVIPQLASIKPSLEYVLQLYQNVNGIQLVKEPFWTFGVSKSF